MSLTRDVMRDLYYRQMKIYVVCKKSNRPILQELAEHARKTAEAIESVTGQIHNPPASHWGMDS